MTFLVGCPVMRREWILPQWFASVETACREARVEPTYVFVLSSEDDATREVIERDNRRVHLVELDEPLMTGERVWNHDRYRHMVFLRNTLLNKVRALQPDLFLSLDSDVLLAPAALDQMIESLDGFDAVGGRTYMTSEGRWCPSHGVKPGGKGPMIRTDGSGVISTDVIMAIKLMTPLAYQVDYEFHEDGEDIGWSLACRRKGLRLGWDGRSVSKHCLERSQLSRVDNRVGY